MAPPTMAGGIPMVIPIDMVMTPIVADVPKDVPRRKETAQFRRKAIRMKMDGSMKSEASVMM